MFFLSETKEKSSFLFLISDNTFWIFLKQYLTNRVIFKIFFDWDKWLGLPHRGNGPEATFEISVVQHYFAVESCRNSIRV